jgi:hypothetical protein
MVRIVWLAAVLPGLVACGGGSKKAETFPDDEGGGAGAPPPSGGEMIPPERMDGIQRELDRKRGNATRCLTQAIDHGEIDKNARGKIAVEFVIARNGQARDLRVIRTSFESQRFQDCVLDVVRKIDFGSLPRDLEWSYTFAFEAF